MSNGKSYRVTCDTAEINLAMSKGLEVNYIGNDCVYAAVEILSEKPKIKMAKTPPTEVGIYYYSPNKNIRNIKILTLLESREAGDFITDSSWFARASELRGYWARVDQSMFEFEGE